MKAVLIVSLIIAASFGLVWFNSNNWLLPTVTNVNNNTPLPIPDTNVISKTKCELSGGEWLRSIWGFECFCENPLYSVGDYCILGLDRHCKSDSDCVGTRTCKCIKEGEVCTNPDEDKYSVKYECVCYQGICNTNSLIPCEEGCLDTEYCGEGFCRDKGKPQ